MPQKVWTQESNRGQAATPNMGENAKKLSPDKCMMPLSYDCEIFPESNVWGHKQPGIFHVRVMLPQQRNPCNNCKSAQYCTTKGHPLPLPQVTSRSLQ